MILDIDTYYTYYVYSMILDKDGVCIQMIRVSIYTHVYGTRYTAMMTFTGQRESQGGR